jgi:putative membrane protein
VVVAPAFGIPVPEEASEMDEKAIINSIVFGLIGMGLFAVAIKLMGKVLPFSIQKEIADDQNTALAVVMGSVLLGIAIIVAAAIHG